MVQGPRPDGVAGDAGEPRILKKRAGYGWLAHVFLTARMNPFDGILVGRRDFLVTNAWEPVLDYPHAIQDAMTELGLVRGSEIPDEDGRAQNTRCVRDTRGSAHD